MKNRYVLFQVYFDFLCLILLFSLKVWWLKSKKFQKWTMKSSIGMHISEVTVSIIQSTVFLIMHFDFRILSEENKKLSIDIASLQLSNRSLVNQNRDEKKKVMDCRLQISDLESRLKTLNSIKNELAESQTQAERLRQSLDANETKLTATERRAVEAEGLIKVRVGFLLNFVGKR